MKRIRFTATLWGENDVRQLLNRFREEEATPYQVSSHWATLQWFDKHFGILDVNSVAALRRKKGAVEEDLVQTVTKPQRKAVVPDRTVIWALEGQYQGDPLGASGPEGNPAKDPRLYLDEFILGVARFQVGASARSNDLQHIYPREVDGTGKTIKLKASQTKTLSQVQGKRHPTPLICPKRSFTGRLWYHVFLDMVQKLTKTPEFENMDYLVPPINKNWLTESTADVYTRQKRDVVVRIWDTVLDGARSLSRTRREVPEDLNHSYWEDPKPTAKQPSVDEDPIRDSPVDVPSQDPDKVEVSPIDVAELPGEDELKVMVSARPCANRFLGRVHLMNPEGRAVGCGWNPRPTQAHELSYDH